jgi:hypothetical protein
MYVEYFSQSTIYPSYFLSKLETLVCRDPAVCSLSQVPSEIKFEKFSELYNSPGLFSCNIGNQIQSN